MFQVPYTIYAGHLKLDFKNILTSLYAPTDSSKTPKSPDSPDLHVSFVISQGCGFPIPKLGNHKAANLKC